MKRIPILAPVILLVLTSAPTYADPRWRALEQVPGHAPVTVDVEGKARTYFRLDRADPLELALTGPGRLQVVTRAEVPAGVEGTVSYRVRIEEKGSLVREQSTESAPALRASIRSARTRVCKSRTFTWTVPAGAHRVRLLGEVAGSAPGAKVLARFLVQAEGPRDLPMVSLTPVEAWRSVTLSEGEKLIPYYTVTAGKPVRVRVVGPTDLELTTRLDFDSTMRGEQSYRIGIWEAGRRLRELAFRTTKATAVVYTDLRDRVPSKMSRVTLPVGEGTHELDVHLAQPMHGSVEIHVRIPQPLVGADE